MKFSPFGRFGAVPETGQTLDVEGVAFTLTRSTPHTRADGEKTRLLTWRGKCRSCGEAFEKVTGLKDAVLHPRCKPCWSFSEDGRKTPAERKKVAAQDWGKRMAGYRAEKVAALAGEVALRCTIVRPEDVKWLPEADVLKGEARFNDGRPRPFEFHPVDGVKAYGPRRDEIKPLVEKHMPRLIELYRLNGGTSPIFA